MKKIKLILASIAAFTMLSSCGKNGNEKLHSKFEKVTDYLFEVTYFDYEENFEEAQTFCTRYMPQLGGCSSVQNGMIRGRNYDWTYDEEPEFIIRVPAKKDRHGSIGVAATTVITAADVESGKEQDFYRILPYITLDGINDAGVTININVVGFGEKGSFKMKTEQADDDVCPLLICRQVLDKAGSVEEAVEIIRKMDVFSLGTQEECHFMISGPKSAEDNTFNTVVVELIPDENQHYQISIIDDSKKQFVNNKPVMTNFHLSGFDGSEKSLTAHPMGYERYQILCEAFDMGKTVKGMQELMKKVYYTKSYDIYSDRIWYSEFASGDLTKDNTGAKALNGDISKAGAYADAIKSSLNDFENATRTSEVKVWHTVHTSVYDIPNRTLYVLPQEAGYSYEFKLNK